MEEITYDLVGEKDVEAAHAIEIQVFPADEAASLETFLYRQANAPSLFLGAYQATPQSRRLVAYITSTLSSASGLSHESMFSHIPGGSSVCIHAVATAPQFQRRGIALSLLKEYLTRLERDGTVERVLLICHEDLLSLYEKAGFELVGKSSVVHGAREWFEMRRILRPSTQADVPSIPQSVIAAALSVQPNTHPRATLLSSVADVNVLVIEADGDRTNKYPIVCVQDGCGTVILQAKTARLRRAPSVQLEPPMYPPPAKLPLLPPLGESTSWWLVSPSPMIFDNIAFSRPLPASEPNALQPRIKLLSCAVCDLGPIGWALEGGSEFWVYCGRVAYQM